MGIIDRLRGTIGTKESRATRSIVSMDAGQPKWTPDRYDLLVQAGIMRNVWARRCVLMIAQAASGVEFALYQRQSSDGKLIEVEPMPRSYATPGVGGMLRILHVAANDQKMTWARYVEETFAYWHASGNHFTELVAGGADRPDDPVMWMYPHVPDDTFKVVPDPIDFVGGYVQDLPGGKVVYEAHQVMHGKFWHPTDRYYGMSPIRAAMEAIDADNAARAWNVAMLQNDARPAGILTADQIDETEYDRLEARLDKRWQGSTRGGRRIRRPLLLSGGLKWIGLSVTPAEMDWLEGKKAGIGEIAAGLGVPVEMIAPSDVKRFATMQEGRKSFWEDTMLPLLDRFVDDVNADVVSRIGDQYVIGYKKNKIPALQEDRDKRWNRTSQAYTSEIMARDEARAELDLPPVDGGALLFASDIRRISQPQPANDPAEFAKAVVEGMVIERVGGAPRVIGKAVDLSTEEAKAAYYTETAAVRLKSETVAESLIADVLDAEREAVIRAIENAPGIDSVLGIAQKAVDVDPWAVAYATLWRGTMDRFARRTLDGLKGGYSDALERKAVDEGEVFDLFTEASAAFAEGVVPARIASVAQTTRDQVTNAIVTGIKDGQTIPQITKAVDEALGGGMATRANTIARTEVLGASGAGGQIMAASTGIPMLKEWISARDQRTRSVPRGDDFDHLKMDGVRVPLEQSFDVPGRGGFDSLLFPGDPRGQAANVIKCRCTNGYVPIV